MRPRAVLFVLTALAWSLGPDLATAEDRPMDGIRPSLRSLFAMQDAVALGHREGVEGQRRVLALLRQERLTGLPADRATALALASYVLSGGPAEVAEAHAAGPDVDETSRSVLLGAAAFMRGDSDEARKMFATIDPLSLPATYGGRIALTKGMLAESASADRERYLAMAIALMPGTLVEEAALRRSALTFAERRDAAGYWRRTERYRRRFPRSLYAPDFINSMAGHVVDFVQNGHAVDLQHLDRACASLPLNQRRSLYLSLAREATARGSAELATLAGRRVTRLAADGSVEHDLGLLYTWIHAIAGEQRAEATARMTAIDRSRLQPVDRDVLDAALWMIEQIQVPVRAVPSDVDDASEALSSLRALEQRVSAELAASDALTASP